MLVLGIHDGTHDAGAALVRDGRLCFAANEERFTRHKGAGGWPTRAIAACFDGTEVRPEDIDAVAFAGLVNPNPVLRALRPAQRRFQLDEGWFYSEEDSVRSRLAAWAQFESPFPFLRSDASAGRLLGAALRPLLSRRVHAAGVTAPVTLHDHHDCHAASAAFTCGYNRALVVVADGLGDGLALTVHQLEAGQLRRVAAMAYPHSYGLLYATLTGFLGFRPFRHEGKMVGLAALGDPHAVDLPFPFEGPPEDRRFTEHFGARLRPWLDQLRRYSREDVCAWLQSGLEHELEGILQYWVARTGVRRVALSGGVTANVRLNQRLARHVDALFVHPHMGDGGLASGAALLTWARTGPHPPPPRLPHAFLGPSFTTTAIEAALAGSGLRYRRVQDLEEQVADRLHAGHIVARFDGPMEYGPRALGNRSILAAATDRRMTDRLNVALSRSDFMPFAPLLLADQAAAWVDDLDAVRDAAAFMTVTVQARPPLRDACPAAVHTDGSLRPQLVDAQHTGWLYRMLTAYSRRSGVPALINTSFNLHEEPIVCTPADAIATWRRARIDALAIGPYLVTA